MSCDLVIGIGETGGPLADLLSLKRNVVRKDLESCSIDGDVEVMHICFPYSEVFIETVLSYIDEFIPFLTIIHSTVVPGTTRKIAERTDAFVAYSPIRGRHTEMHRGLMRYTKFVAAPSTEALRAAVAYFDEVGLFHVGIMYHSDALELAKLVSTSYFGLLIAWSQELFRYCDEALNMSYEAVLGFIRESEHLPRVIFHPGYIQGHCVMRNLDLLEEIHSSPFIDAIRDSNERCTVEQKADETRYRPRRLR